VCSPRSPWEAGEANNQSDANKQQQNLAWWQSDRGTPAELLKGTDPTHAWLPGAELAEITLEGTDLSDAHLGLADYSDANLKDAKLSAPISITPTSATGHP
jgi:uncharacterized protein YjbI with pentapeptide repeats